MWHGKATKAVSRLKRINDAFGIVAAEPYFTLWMNLARLIGYLESNDRFLVNYQRRHYKGLPISSSIAESAVNEVLSWRMAKKRQMRWSDEGAHLLAQVRVRAINGNCIQGRMPHRCERQSRFTNPATTLASHLKLR